MSLELKASGLLLCVLFVTPDFILVKREAKQSSLANLKRKRKYFENIKGYYQMSNECHGNRFKFFNTLGLIEFI